MFLRLGLLGVERRHGSKMEAVDLSCDHARCAWIDTPVPRFWIGHHLEEGTGKSAMGDGVNVTYSFSLLDRFQNFSNSRHAA